MTWEVMVCPQARCLPGASIARVVAAERTWNCPTAVARFATYVAVAGNDVLPNVPIKKFATPITA